MLSHEQVVRWQEIFNTPGLLCLVVVAELPFVWYSQTQVHVKSKVAEAAAVALAAAAAAAAAARSIDTLLPRKWRAVPIPEQDRPADAALRRHAPSDHWIYHEELLAELTLLYLTADASVFVVGNQPRYRQGMQ